MCMYVCVFVCLSRVIFMAICAYIILYNGTLHPLPQFIYHSHILFLTIYRHGRLLVVLFLTLLVLLTANIKNKILEVISLYCVQVALIQDVECPLHSPNYGNVGVVIRCRPLHLSIRCCHFHMYKAMRSLPSRNEYYSVCCL